MASPSSATPAATAARRRVFETVLREQSLHGSEELATLPTPTIDGADPNAETLSANVNQNRDVTTGNHSSSGPADAESGYFNGRGWEYHNDLRMEPRSSRGLPRSKTKMICEWNHAQVVAFLEARPISKQGMRPVIEDTWNGTLLLDVIEDDQVHKCVYQVIHKCVYQAKRLALIRAVKDTMVSTKPAAEPSNNESSTGRIHLQNTMVSTKPAAEPSNNEFSTGLSKASSDQEGQCNTMLPMPQWLSGWNPYPQVWNPFRAQVWEKTKPRKLVWNPFPVQLWKS